MDNHATTSAAAPERVWRAGRPGLAVVTMRQSGDGIAYVARLLKQALYDLTGAEAWQAALDPARLDGVSLAERFRFFWKLGAVQASRRVDWLLFNHLALTRTQSLLPSWVRLPYAVFLNGVESWGSDLRPEQQHAVAAARLRLAISHYTAARIAIANPAFGPVIATPLGLFEFVSAGVIDTALVDRVGARSALIVGRMVASERYKGHDELLECWPAVREEVPDAQLIIAGRGDDVLRLESKARGLGLGDSVVFTGFVDDATLEAIRRRVALFTMPSRGEGFGFVYVEAMRAGLPCVASSDDAGGEVVVDGVTGFVVRQADRGALVRAITTLLRDDRARRQMGAAGRVRYEREFTYEAFRQRLAVALEAAFEILPARR